MNTHVSTHLSTHVGSGGTCELKIHEKFPGENQGASMEDTLRYALRSDDTSVINTARHDSFCTAVLLRGDCELCLTLVTHTSKCAIDNAKFGHLGARSVYVPFDADLKGPPDMGVMDISSFFPEGHVVRAVADLIYIFPFACIDHLAILLRLTMTKRACKRAVDWCATLLPSSTHNSHSNVCMLAVRATSSTWQST